MPASYRLPARYRIPAPMQIVGGRSRSQSPPAQRRSGGSNAGRHPCRTRSRSVSFGGQPETGPARHGIDGTVVVRAPEDIEPHISAVPTGGEGGCLLAGFRTCEAVMASPMRVPCVFRRRSIRPGRFRSAPRARGMVGMRPSVGYPHGEPVGGSQDGPGAREEPYAGTAVPDSGPRDRCM